MWGGEKEAEEERSGWLKVIENAGFGDWERERECWQVAWENKARDRARSGQRRERGVQSIRARVDFEKAELTNKFSHSVSQSASHSTSRQVGQVGGEGGR